MADNIHAQIAEARAHLRSLEKEVTEMKEVMRGSWDEMKMMLEKSITEAKHENKERDTKIDAIQSWRTWLVGVATVLGILGTAVGGIASAMVIHRLESIETAVQPTVKR